MRGYYMHKNGGLMNNRSICIITVGDWVYHAVEIVIVGISRHCMLNYKQKALIIDPSAFRKIFPFNGIVVRIMMCCRQGQ